MTDGGVIRSCRRRCSGCDPCWICRKSYPASLSITSLVSGSSSGSGGSGSPPPTGWVGCCGHAAGTYAPATPFGQNIDFDNGVTIHRTFKAPYHVVDIMGRGSNGNYPACEASWRFKKSIYTQGYSRNPSTGEYDIEMISSGVVRCQGADADPILYGTNGVISPYDQGRGFVVELLSDLIVKVSVGGFPFFEAGDPRIASTGNSTRVDCFIQERFFGFTNFTPTGTGIGSSAGMAVYDVIKLSRYSTHLPKPCPLSGTFSLPLFGVTYVPVLLYSAFGLATDFATYPSCVSTDEAYGVSITI